MSHENKTKEQLMTELIELRQRIAELEASEMQYKRVEKALRESKDKYSTIVEKGNDGVAIAQHGKIKFANSKLLDLFGFTLDETVGKPFIDFITPEFRDFVMGQYKNRIAGEDVPYKYEINLYTKDGKKIPVEINACLIEYEGKQADLVIVREISERKEVEKELRESEKKFREFTELLPETVYETDTEGNLTFTNQIGFENTGYSQEDLDRGLNAFQLVVPEDHEKLNENIRRLMRGEEIGINEYTARRKDGSKFPITIHSTLVKDDKGKPIGLRGIIFNITERKKAEKEVLRAKEYLEKMFNSVTDSIFVTDMNRRFITCNNATERIFGYKKEEIIGKSSKLFYPTKQAFDEMGVTTVKEIKEKGYAEVEIILRRKDGTNFPAYVAASLLKETDGKPIGIVGTVRDITNRKRAEEKIKNYTENLEKLVEERAKELRESEEKLKVILSGIGDLITIQNKDLDIIWVNQPMRELWGEIVGKKCYKAYKGLTEPCPECSVKKVFKEGKTTVSERVSTLPDGTPIHVLVTSSPLHDAEGKIIAVVEVDKDITKRKKLEQELKNYTENLETIIDTQTKELNESKEKLNAILTGIADLITIQNRDLDIIWVNQPMRTLYGDIVGRKCYNVYKRLDEPCEDCYVEKVFNEGKTVISERESILPDGSSIHVFITSSPVRDAEGNIVAILEVEKDITEQKKLERQLVESEAKQQAILSAIGDLITIQNKDLDIIWVNQPEREIYGDVIGQKCYEAYKGLTEPCSNCTVKKVINDEQNVVSEGVVICPDGRPMNILTTSSPIRDAEGNIVAVIEVVKDITKRKQLEMQLKDYTENLEKLVEERTSDLKASEKRYRGLYESSIDGIASLDMDGNIIECNQAYANMLGYIKDDLYNLKYQDLTPDRWYDFETEIVTKQILPKGYSNVYEKEHIKKDGTIFPVSVRGWLIKDKESTPTGMWTIVRDISEQKKMERQLKKYTEDLEASEERYRGLYESSLDGIVFLDLEGNILECNQAFADMLEYTKKQLYNSNYRELFPSKLFNYMAKILSDQIFTRGYSDELETEAIKIDGTIISASVKAWRIKDKENNPIGTWTIVRDISERKILESQLKNYAENLEKLVEERTERLRESERRYRGLYESSIDGIFYANLNRNITDCNKALADMLGYTKEDLCKLNFFDITPRKWFNTVEKRATEHMYKTGYSEAYEQEIKTKDGTTIPVSVRVWFVKEKEDRPVGVWGIVRDITERKRAEEKIKEYTENLEKLVEERALELKDLERRYSKY